MIHQEIKNSLKEAMKAKDTVRLSVIRDLMTAFVNELVSTSKTPQDLLDDDKALQVIKRKAKQRRESITQFEAGGRPELAGQEKAELEILETMLPEQMSAEEITKIVEEQKNITGAINKSDLGKLMGSVMNAIKSSNKDADGKMVQKVVLEALN